MNGGRALQGHGFSSLLVAAVDGTLLPRDSISSSRNVDDLEEFVSTMLGRVLEALAAKTCFKREDHNLPSFLVQQKCIHVQAAYEQTA